MHTVLNKQQAELFHTDRETSIKRETAIQGHSFVDHRKAVKGVYMLYTYPIP